MNDSKTGGYVPFCSPGSVTYALTDALAQTKFHPLNCVIDSLYSKVKLHVSMYFNEIILTYHIKLIEI